MQKNKSRKNSPLQGVFLITKESNQKIKRIKQFKQVKIHLMMTNTLYTNGIVILNKKSYLKIVTIKDCTCIITV